MKYAAITSMSKSYYDKCGKYMLNSFKQHWNSNMLLHVYNEDNFSVDDSFIEMGWELGSEYHDFQKRHKNNRVKTFSKKGFSIIHAMDNIDCDRLIWIDADVIIKKEIDILDDLISDDELSAHFSVWHTKNKIRYHSCETGFFILNKKHPNFNDFKNTYKDIYVNDKTNKLRRFYDGEVYGKTIELMIEKGCKVNNLNPGPHKTPMPRSVLKDYIEHLKAGLKERTNLSNIPQIY
jgi:hypothetical protein